MDAMSAAEKAKLISKKKGERLLLVLDSGTITTYSVKEKDKIELSQSIEVDSITTKQGLTESTKYLFSLTYSTGSSLFKSPEKACTRLTLGTESECQRKEWAFGGQVASRWVDSHNSSSSFSLAGGNNSNSAIRSSKSLGTLKRVTNASRESMMYIAEVKM